MPIIKIDGEDYDFDRLNEAAKKQLECLQYVDAELRRLDQQAAVFKTARVGYYRALKQALAPLLPSTPAPVAESAPLPGTGFLSGDTIKFE